MKAKKPSRLAWIVKDSLGLLDKVRGDGRQLVHITPLPFQPDHYVVRVDSKTLLDSNEWLAELTQVYRDLAEQFGAADFSNAVWGRLTLLKRRDWRSEDDVKAELLESR